MKPLIALSIWVAIAIATGVFLISADRLTRHYNISMNAGMVASVGVLSDLNFLGVKAERREHMAIVTGYQDYGPDKRVILILQETKTGITIKVSASPQGIRAKKIFKLLKEKIDDLEL